MTTWTRRIPFKVDVGGIIELMGTSLYSRSDTAIRELIQNAHDAVVRRRHRDLGYQGRLVIEQDAVNHRLHFHDDGIGLTAAEAEEYLSTLGVGITGLLKKGTTTSATTGPADATGDLIGQFGIGMFSAFMLAERLTVESRHLDADQAIRWEAGAGTDIELSSCERRLPGTTVTLTLKPPYYALAESPERVEQAVKEFADFVRLPIFLNDSRVRANVIQAAWFEASPDREAVESELETYFEETPLDVLPLRLEKPVAMAGALYVTPQRTPGFSGQPVVTVTLRRMVISRRIQGLIPAWAPFLRGVLELPDCTPTASREDLVRDAHFARTREVLEHKLFEHLEQLAEHDSPRLESILTWHRYHFTGASLDEPRLRALLRRCYRLPTSKGALPFDEILRQSPADPLLEGDAEHVIWYNTDRRQESWINSLFGGGDVPCVHAVRTFEESLLATWVAEANQEGTVIDLRLASPQAPRFAETVLGVRDLEDSPPAWQAFLGATGARVRCACFNPEQPVMAFLNERSELIKTFDELKKQGTIPSGFQRLIDAHFGDGPTAQNEVLLNRSHRLVQRALEQKTTSPLASVLRLLVLNALHRVGASLPRAAHQQQVEDLDWIAEALWGKKT